MKSRSILPLVFLAPALVLYVVFFIVPVVYAGTLSFAQWNLVSPTVEWVGLDNYADLLADAVFWTSLGNTVVYAVATVLPSMVLGLVLAALVERSGRRSRVFFRTMLFLPVVASLAVTALVWVLLLSPHDGHVNLLLAQFGWTGPNWLNDPTWAMVSLVVVGVWRGASYNLVLYIAGLKGIDPQYYEAARLDGAGPVGQFLHITVPLVAPVSLFVMVVSIIQSFQVFATVNIMTHGGPNNATNVLVYQVYQEAFQFFDIGRSSAAAMVMFVLVLALAIVQIRLVDRSTQP